MTTRAERPVTRVDFVNLQPEVVPDAPAPQPDNHELAQAGAIAFDDMVIACSRSLVDETLRNPEVFSSADLVDQGNIRPLIPLAIDPPAHVRYRRLLDPLFAPRQIDRLEDDIAMRVNHFIDRFADRGECDFTAEFAELFPSSVFLGMMGLDWDELDTLVALRDGILRPGTKESAPEERTRIQKETAERVYAYFDAVLDERTATPRDDILSLLTTAVAGGERLTREEMLDICFVLLTAGLDTVTDSLTCFWAFLAQHPDHQRQLVEQPEVIPQAVEELLRWESPVPAVIRWARQDHSVGAHPIAAGHLVMANLSSANVDPEQYPDPLEVRFDREGNPHLAFGGGIHRCLGSHLARRELRVALREWHRRIPAYSLAPGYRVAYKPPLRFVPDLQLVWPTDR
jgi:cytochrome P450